MNETTKPDMQLLSKADVMREYGYPKQQLDKDIQAGAIAHFQSAEWGRYYIPRKAVEDRIAALSAVKGKGNR